MTQELSKLQNLHAFLFFEKAKTASVFSSFVENSEHSLHPSKALKSLIRGKSCIIISCTFIINI